MLKQGLIRMTGNRFVQDLLDKSAIYSQYLMGIGSGTHVLFSGEQVIFDVLKKTYRPPYCVFDVGANKGLFLRLALNNLAGEEFSIHSFEPGLGTYNILRESVQKDRRVTLNNIGIGSENGEAILYSDGVGSGLASLTNRRLDHYGIHLDRSEKVVIRTIDSYCLERSIEFIHLLKIDIEGHELEALTGAKKMLDSRSVGVVSFEFGGCNIDTKTYFQDFWYFFKDIGMNVFRITPSGYLYPVQAYRESYEQFSTTNFIAIPRACEK